MYSYVILPHSYLAAHVEPPTTCTQMIPIVYKHIRNGKIDQRFTMVLGKHVAQVLSRTPQTSWLPAHAEQSTTISHMNPVVYKHSSYAKQHLTNVLIIVEA